MSLWPTPALRIRLEIPDCPQTPRNLAKASKSIPMSSEDSFNDLHFESHIGCCTIYLLLESFPMATLALCV